ncbi:hypothetical protein BGM19_38555 [Streptomyces agglomeratus]|uniref:Radical SAM core domain-containing protein n=1 Tax=Streptomyces agglomeratus TaxID=285458 RepID=A0A1E5NYS5_9ACTN|nr:radical SAM protein [Streptomyces agglomeratus]OEJ21424.1 hypothetical protein AS594_38285 [Streptomyces agglomeratus]OEJ36426.1 hypothetical protein BGK72_37515 [Streptomyces agglomeratus]OEJ56554.1 hypothetical protein BGM19_38555 [Streptomyces agglomeratus]
MSFDTFVWKVASRCNLDCTYCYVYNASDTSWNAQPRFMSDEVAAAAAQRIKTHAQERALERVVINFHGGEPFLGGSRHLEALHSRIRTTFRGTGIEVETAVQSNGLLFSADIGDLLLERDIGLYVSLDGPPEINDRRRIDLRGAGTGKVLETRLETLCTQPYKRIFQGFLCVVDPASDPAAVLDYLAQYDPPLIDFLLPLNNHDTMPTGGAGAFTDWLCACFDHWMDLNSGIQVKTFASIILGLLGRTRGDSESEYLVVETDGSIELDDTLKTAFHGAATLGYDVFTHSLEDVSTDPRLLPLRDEVARLSPTCRACGFVEICRGGHVSHRYSAADGLLNPSVYCSALQQLILHTRQRLLREMPAGNSVSHAAG